MYTAQKWSFPLRISPINVTKSENFAMILYSQSYYSVSRFRKYKLYLSHILTKKKRKYKNFLKIFWTYIFYLDWHNLSTMRKENKSIINEDKGKKIRLPYSLGVLWPYRPPALFKRELHLWKTLLKVLVVRNLTAQDCMPNSK